MTMPTPQPEPRGDPQRAGLVGGTMLVIVGVVFLVARLANIELGAVTWPIWIVGPGLALFVASFAVGGRGGLGLAIPGAMVTAVGAVLWIQATYDLYQTWAYAWALVAPGSIGLGMLVYGLVTGDRQVLADGTRTFLVGIGLFLGFGLFFEGVVGLSGGKIAGLDDVLPYAVIALGALFVVASLFGRGERRQGS